MKDEAQRLVYGIIPEKGANGDGLEGGRILEDRSKKDLAGAVWELVDADREYGGGSIQ